MKYLAIFGERIYIRTISGPYTKIYNCIKDALDRQLFFLIFFKKIYRKDKIKKKKKRKMHNISHNYRSYLEFNPNFIIKSNK